MKKISRKKLVEALKKSGAFRHGTYVYDAKLWGLVVSMRLYNWKMK